MNGEKLTRDERALWLAWETKAALLAKVTTLSTLAAAPKTPRPIPAWFWVWARWMLGHGEFKPYGRKNFRVRPEAPVPRAGHIPAWASAEFKARFLRPKPKPPIPVMHSSLAFFHHWGLWIAFDPAGTDPDVLAQRAAGRYGVVYVQVLDGETMAWSSMQTHVYRLEQRGFTVCGWGWWPAGGHPERLAEAAWERCETLGLGGYVFNGEKYAEGLDASGAYLSGRAVRRFRELAGAEFPLGWSPEPRLDLDHVEFRRSNVCLMQQAYPFENYYDAQECAAVARSQGYVLGQCVPLLGAHGGSIPEHQGERYPAWRHRADLDASGLPFGVVYPVDGLMSDDQVSLSYLGTLAA